ncbi:FUSC family protein [Planosporangium mesophilum]|uniref:FUSC family protein n=1 Tax=Planosporangium mesophilum TaxID=689768 RepID=A0A8J3X2Y7_9ACTN|nr:aromatic acid exporter family protein [Planosporangium mesophilum]NJC86615.1 hypothetical protein [Planosporangium mesophilum]GII25401.1 hypothetical protein Pme01_49980 [Planosporangium mesophilum]
MAARGGGDGLAPGRSLMSAPSGAADATRRGREPRPRLRRTDKISTAQVMKATVAAVVAYVLAQRVLGGDHPMLLAALTALLVVKVTLYETIRHGWQRIGSVIVGVVIAALLSSVFGLTWWSLGITVLAALLLGKVLRLGDHSLEIAVNAMAVLVLGSHNHLGLNRVFETLIGAGVGVLVSLAAPSVHVQPASDAIGRLAEEIGRVLRSIAVDVERGWTHERALDGLRRARALEKQVRAAQGALAQAEESLRLNPRRAAATTVPERLRSALTALEYSAIHVRVTCSCLADRVEGMPSHELPDPEARLPLAGLLDAAGKGVLAFGQLVASDVAGPVDSADALRRAVRRARSLRDLASEALLVDARKEPKLWRVHGAVLAHLDRLLDDIDPGGNAAAYAISQRTLVPSGAASPAGSSPAGVRERLLMTLRRRPDAA